MIETKFSKQTKEWEKDCIKTRRWLWLRKRRLSVFDITPDDFILDLGCGDGLNIKILKQMGINNIVGIDISRYLLKLAKKNNPDVKFFLGSADKLPFKNGKFDIVLADSVFHHLIDYPKSIDEIRRVLKKGGRLGFIDPHSGIIRKLLDILTVSSLADFLPFFKGRKPAYLAEKELMDNWLKNEQVFLSLLKRMGFKKQFCKVDLLSIVGQYRKVK